MEKGIVHYGKRYFSLWKKDIIHYGNMYFSLWKYEKLNFSSWKMIFFIM